MNNIYPWATLKQKNLYLNMKKKKPALALVPGAFNTEIPGYSIKFDEKYGEEENLLKNVHIADLSAAKGKIKVITAEKGMISTEEGSKYMTLTLDNGNYYEEHIKNGMNPSERVKMPASSATFKTYTINIDISSFNDSEKLNDTLIKEHHGMLSINQLSDLSKEKKIDYDKYIDNRANYFYNIIKAKKLYKYSDSLIDAELDSVILNNFNLKNKSLVLDESLRLLKRNIDRNESRKKTFKSKRKLLNLYDHEFSYRISFSLACLVLFFIGAPLGSIIRKGGFGLPMIMAIAVFVIYFFISKLGGNLSEESAISTLFGSWLSTLILLPFGILLTRRATKGMGIFNIEAIFENVNKFFRKFIKKTNN